MERTIRLTWFARNEQCSGRYVDDGFTFPEKRLQLLTWTAYGRYWKSNDDDDERYGFAPTNRTGHDEDAECDGRNGIKIDNVTDLRDRSDIQLHGRTLTWRVTGHLNYPWRTDWVTGETNNSSLVTIAGTTIQINNDASAGSSIVILISLQTRLSCDRQLLQNLFSNN